MSKSRSLLIFSAMMAIAGWINVQAMACCWFPAKASAASTTVVVHSTHDCCPNAEEPIHEGIRIHSGDMGLHSIAHDCCSRYEDIPAVASSDPSRDIAPVSYVEFVDPRATIPENLHCAVAFPDSGPPSSLVFQRLLI